MQQQRISDRSCRRRTESHSAFVKPCKIALARLNIATAVRAVGVKAPGRSFNGGDGGGDDGDAEEERRTPPGDSGSSGKGAADGRQLQSDPLAAAPGREGVAQPARPPHTRLCSGKWLTWHSLQQYQTMTPSSLHRLQLYFRHVEMCERNRKVYGRPDVHRNKASSPSNVRAHSPSRAPRPR